MLQFDKSPSVTVTYSTVSSESAASAAAAWSAKAATTVSSNSLTAVVVAGSATGSSEVSTSTPSSLAGAADSGLAEALRLAGRRKVVRPLAKPRLQQQQPQQPEQSSPLAWLGAQACTEQSKESPSVCHNSRLKQLSFRDQQSVLGWPQVQPILQLLMSEVAEALPKSSAGQDTPSVATLLTEADLREAMRLLLLEKQREKSAQPKPAPKMKKPRQLTRPREVELVGAQGDVGQPDIIRMIVCVPNVEVSESQKFIKSSGYVSLGSICPPRSYSFDAPEAPVNSSLFEPALNRPTQLHTESGIIESSAMPGVELCRDSSSSSSSSTPSPPGIDAAEEEGDYVARQTVGQIEPKRSSASGQSRSRGRSSLPADVIGGLHRQLQIEWDEVRSTSSRLRRTSRNESIASGQDAELGRPDVRESKPPPVARPETDDGEHLFQAITSEDGHELVDRFQDTTSESKSSTTASADFEGTWLGQAKAPSDSSLADAEVDADADVDDTSSQGEAEDDDDSDDSEGSDSTTPTVNKASRAAVAAAERRKELLMSRDMELQRDEEAAAAAKLAATAAAAQRKELRRTLAAVRVPRASCPGKVSGHLTDHEEKVRVTKRIIAGMSRQCKHHSRLELHRLCQKLRLVRPLKLNQCRRSSSDDTAGLANWSQQ